MKIDIYIIPTKTNLLGNNHRPYLPTPPPTVSSTLSLCPPPLPASPLPFSVPLPRLSPAQHAMAATHPYRRRSEELSMHCLSHPWPFEMASICSLCSFTVVLRLEFLFHILMRLKIAGPARANPIIQYPK